MTTMTNSMRGLAAPAVRSDAADANLGLLGGIVMRLTGWFGDPRLVGEVREGDVTARQVEYLLNRAMMPDGTLSPTLDVVSTAQARASQFGIPNVLTDYRELLARDDVDAVVIGIPTRFHAEAAVQALQAGKHVLCEKPLARTLEECDAIAAAARESGRVFQIAFVRRFDREWGTIRELIQNGAIGRPQGRPASRTLLFGRTGERRD